MRANPSRDVATQLRLRKTINKICLRSTPARMPVPIKFCFFILWGRLLTCGGLIIRLVMYKKIVRPIANRPQVNNLPHMSRIN